MDLVKRGGHQGKSGEVMGRLWCSVANVAADYTALKEEVKAYYQRSVGLFRDSVYCSVR